jgi:uroporphyrinogen-III synthase
MHVLITRPEPDAAELRARLEALGHEVTVEPLLRIERLPIAAAALDGVAAVIVTSRNGLRALAESAAIEVARKLPIIAVGPGTAQLAREIGFAHVIEGPGTARDLVPVIVETSHSLPGPLAHARGEEVAFDLHGALKAQGIMVREVIAYRAIPASGFEPRTAALLASGAIDAVILMSPRTGATFARLMTGEGLREAAGKLVFLCLSPAVAASVEPLAPGRVEVSESPNSAAMLAAVTRVATLWSGV